MSLSIMKWILFLLFITLAVMRMVYAGPNRRLGTHLCPRSTLSSFCDHIVLGSSVLEQSTPLMVFEVDNLEGLERSVKSAALAHCIDVCLLFDQERTDVGGIERALSHVPGRRLTVIAESASAFTSLQGQWTKDLESTVVVVEMTSSELIFVHVVCPGTFVTADMDTFDKVTLRAVMRANEGVPHGLHESCPHGFNGRHLEVSSRGLPPFIVYPRLGEEASFSGVDVDITKVLAEKFNFTFNVHVANMMGMRLPNSTYWDGVVGHVMNGSAHFGIGNPALDFERFSVVDYTRPIYNLDTVFISPKPKPTPPYQNILKPFTPEVWSFVLLSLLLLTLVFPMVTYVSEMDSAEKEWRVRQATLFPYATLFKQNPSLSFMRSPSRRLLVGVWLPFVLLVTLAFSGNLRAFLVAVDYERPIDNAQDILDLDRPFFLSLGTSLVTSIKGSPLQVYRSLYDRVKERDGFFHLTSGWLPDDVESRLIGSGGAFLFPRVSYQMRLRVLKSKYGHQPLRESNELGFSYHVGFLVPRAAFFKTDFDAVLAALVEAGIVERFKVQYFPLEALHQSEDAHEIDEVIHFDDILAELVGLVVGIIASSIIIAIEILGQSSKQ